MKQSVQLHTMLCHQTHHAWSHQFRPLHLVSIASRQAAHLSPDIIECSPWQPMPDPVVCDMIPVCPAAIYPAPEAVPTRASRVIQQNSFMIVSAIGYSSPWKLFPRVIITALGKKKFQLFYMHPVKPYHRSAVYHNALHARILRVRVLVFGL